MSLENPRQPLQNAKNRTAIKAYLHRLEQLQMPVPKASAIAQALNVPPHAVSRMLRKCIFVQRGSRRYIVSREMPILSAADGIARLNGDST